MPEVTVSDVTVALSIPADQITVAAPLPEVVTQHNALAVVGVPPAQFLALLRAPGFPLAVAKHGKLRAVERTRFVAWLLGPGRSAEPSEPNRMGAVAARLGVMTAGDGRKR